MTPGIGLVLAVLGITIVMFMTETLRVHVCIAERALVRYK